MIGTITARSLAIGVLLLLVAPVARAQDAGDRATLGTDAAGSFAPAGAPLEPPMRVEAGGSCIVALKQAYAVAGTLSGSMEVDYRILVHGPCEVPPVPGRYDEEWIAYGTFTGTVDGAEASGSLTYTAQVHAGGDVEGRIVLGGELEGQLAVTGNFDDGRLSYRGRVRRGGR